MLQYSQKNIFDMNPLPSDCVKIILDYTDLQDAPAVCTVFTDKQKYMHLLKERRSPIRLFSDIVDDSRELLYYMSVNRCVMSRSRAANYI